MRMLRAQFELFNVGEQSNQKIPRAAAVSAAAKKGKQYKIAAADFSLRSGEKIIHNMHKIQFAPPERYRERERERERQCAGV